jgi:hypothetical protein
MSHPDDAQRCDFCRNGKIARQQQQQVAFRQWTDKGYVFCRAEIPIGSCDRCGSRHWNADAGAIIEDAVRCEYEKLSPAKT